MFTSYILFFFYLHGEKKFWRKNKMAQCQNLHFWKLVYEPAACAHHSPATHTHTPNWCWTPPQDYFQAVPRLQNNTYHNNKPVNWLSLEEGCKCLPVEESKAVTLKQRCAVFFYDHKFAVWQSNLWFTDLVEGRPWHWHSAPCWPDIGVFHNHTFKNKHSWSCGRFL